MVGYDLRQNALERAVCGVYQPHYVDARSVGFNHLLEFSQLPLDSSEAGAKLFLFLTISVHTFPS